jgi:hypothetical protein
MRRRITNTPAVHKSVLGLAILFLNPILAVAAPNTNPAPSLRWFDAKTLSVEGKGWLETKDFYDRLPAKAEGTVRRAVWDLGTDSAGLCVHFVTDATAISVRWTVRNHNLAMSHMPASGVSGVDLYARYHGKWRWAGAARPETEVTTEKELVSGMTREWRDWLLYLPLYNGVQDLEIGVAAEAHCERPKPWPDQRKPVVFYGTSIVQGGCASRPGMAYPAILGRRFDLPIINLGFSGNAHCEPEIASLLADLDPVVYVLDPLPNMSAGSVAERMPLLLTKLRAAHSRTPIILVENTEVGNGEIAPSKRTGYTKANTELRRIFQQRVRAGDEALFYISGAKLLNDDGQDTVDGVHPTDLGFIHMAEAMEPTLKRAIRAAARRP